MNQMERLEVISIAIWLRDNASRVEGEELVEKIMMLSDYGIFSNRQLSRIVDNKLSHVKIGAHTRKKGRSGGMLAPESLEDIRDALFSRERNSIDYSAVKSAVEKGTSQNMITKLTGISQSSISRKMSHAS